MATAFSKDNIKSKLGWSNSFNRDGAFPLDINQYFGSYADAEAAAATAKDFGSTESVYYYGMQVYVFDGTTCTAYLIQGDGTLTETGKTIITTGTTNGTINVDGVEVAVAGLGSAAYTDSTAYDVLGAADTALASAKSYTDDSISALDFDDGSELIDYENFVAVKYVKQANGIISQKHTEIENVADTAVSGQYVSSVSQTKGQISVTRASLPDYTGVYDAYGTAETYYGYAKDYAKSTINESLSVLLDNSIDDAAVEGQYVSAVKTTTDPDDGSYIIEIERASLPDYSTTYDAYGSADTAYSDAVTYVDTALTWESF